MRRAQSQVRASAAVIGDRDDAELHNVVAACMPRVAEQFIKIEIVHSEISALACVCLLGN